MWPSGLTIAMTLTLNFQGQIWNLLCLNQNWSDCHETKNKHIDWTQGLKCDHRVWPWSWLWPCIFKVKCGICYISSKSGPIATKRKVNLSIELQASNVTNGFDLGYNLDLWIFNFKCDLVFDHIYGLDQGFSWSNFEIAVSQNGRADSERVDFWCRRAIDSSSFT